MDSVLGTKPSIEPTVIIESGAQTGEHLGTRSAESIEDDSGSPLSSPRCSSTSVSLSQMTESSVSMPQTESSFPTLPSEDSCSSHESSKQDCK